MLAFLVIMVFLTPMLWACVTDFTTMTIPNWISIYLIAAYFVIAPMAWQGWADFATHLMVFAATFSVCLFFFAIGGFGGGDAKLLAATSIWWVWQDMFVYILATAVIGGAIAFFLMIGRKWVPARILSNKYMMLQFKDEKRMPYGLALAAGALLTLPHSSLFMYVSGGPGAI